jgi:hypothetical protein
MEKSIINPRALFPSTLCNHNGPLLIAQLDYPIGFSMQDVLHKILLFVQANLSISHEEFMKFIESLGLTRVGDVLVGETYDSNHIWFRVFVVRFSGRSFTIEGSRSPIRALNVKHSADKLLEQFNPDLFLIKPIVPGDIRYQFLSINGNGHDCNLPSIDYIRAEVAKFSFW